MRFPWQKEPIYLESEKPKRAKETVRSVGDKLLIRQMKKQPDGFGLEMAKKEHGTPSEAKGGTTSELMKQLRELREFDNEFFGSDSGGGKRRKGGKGGMWSGEGTWLSEVLNSQLAVGLGAQLVQLLRQVNKSAKEVGNMAPPPGMVSVIDSQGKIAQVPEEIFKQLREPTVEASPPKVKEPPKQLPELKLEMIMDLLELEPAVAWEALQANEPDWVDYLSKNSYETLTKNLEKLAEMPEYEQFADNIKEFITTRQHWLMELVGCAHGVTVNEEE